MSRDKTGSLCDLFVGYATLMVWLCIFEMVGYALGKSFMDEEGVLLFLMAGGVVIALIVYLYLLRFIIFEWEGVGVKIRCSWFLLLMLLNVVGGLVFYWAVWRKMACGGSRGRQEGEA